MMRHTACRAYG